MPISAVDSGDVRDLDVFAEHELRPRVRARRGARAVEVDEQALAGLEHAHVGDHAPLRREVRRVAPGAGRQRLDVVREQALEVTAAVGARSRAAGRATTGRRAPAPSVQGSIFFG